MPDNGDRITKVEYDYIIDTLRKRQTKVSTKLWHSLELAGCFVQHLEPCDSVLGVTEDIYNTYCELYGIAQLISKLENMSPENLRGKVVIPNNDCSD